jgi:hypothetical protein
MVAIESLILNADFNADIFNSCDMYKNCIFLTFYDMTTFHIATLHVSRV